MKSYHRDWEITGPIVPLTITGRPAAYTIWTARDLVIGNRHHERPFVALTREELVAHIDLTSEYDEEPCRPVPWSLRQHDNGFWYASARIPGGQKRITARAQSRDEAEAKLRTRLASLRYFPAEASDRL